MSIKERVEKQTENSYVLPRTGNMKVDAVAFLSEKLFLSSEEETWQQIQNMASYEGVIGAYLLPDCHAGYGAPIGSAIVTEDTLIQSANGYDISCGILHMKCTGVKAHGVRGKYVRERFVTETEKRVATGMGSSRPALMPNFSLKQAEDILRFGAKALDIPADLCERQYVPVKDDLDLTKVEKAYSKMLPQLGSVGAGNHFIEMQCDPETGEVWVMVHCGSRGYGWQTADYFFYQAAALRNIPVSQRESSWLRMDEHLGQQYWNYCASAANYAIANRHIIVRGVQEALQEVFNATAEVYYEISHNLVQEETLVLPDGTTKKGFVHRKGATRAFPAGHPDLIGTKWEKTGHPCLIPGSMRDGAAILEPQAGAYKTSCSVNHGSGRILGRKEAKRKLGHKQDRINEEMSTIKRNFNGVPIEGIVSNCKNIPLDECGHVYKDLDDVLAVLEAENIAKVKHRLFPIANMKGAD